MIEQGAPSEKIQEVKGVCHYFPGIFATRLGMAGLENPLQDIYKDVHVYNSSVSADGLDRQRFDKTAVNVIADIERSKNTGETVDLVGHSQGSTDMVKVFQAIEKLKPDFFQNQENLKNLHIILFGPSGFYKGLSGVLEYLGRIKNFLRSNTQIGIASLNMVLPSGISANVLTNALTEALPAHTQHVEGESSVATLVEQSLTTESEEFLAFGLKEKEMQQLKEIDTKLQTAIEAKDWVLFRRSLSARGKLMTSYVNAAFAGTNRSTKETVFGSIKNTARFAYSFLGMIPLYKTMFFGEAYKRFVDLTSKGVAIDFLLPEFDSVVPAEVILGFINENIQEKPAKIINLQSATHNSSALNWLGLMPALSKLQ